MTKQTTGGALMTFKCGGAGATSPIFDEGTQAYVPGISSKVGSTTTYDHHDLIGSAGLQTNASSAVVSTRSYDAFCAFVSLGTESLMRLRGQRS